MTIHRIARTLALLLILLATVSGFAETDALRAAADAAVPEDARFVRSERDDGCEEYEYLAADGSVSYSVSVSRKTGLVVETEMDVIGPHGSKTVVLTEEEIGAAVLELYPEAEVLSVYLDRDDGLSVYEVIFRSENILGKLELHPETGAIEESDLRYDIGEDILRAWTERASANGGRFDWDDIEDWYD